MNHNNEYVRRCRSRLSPDKKKWINQYYCRSWKSWIGRYTHMAIIEDIKHGRAYNISSEMVMEMLKQNGNRCVLTNVELRHDKSLWALSIDRINNNVGHTIDNVQLTCRGINLAKNVHRNDDVKHFIDVICNGNDRPRKISRDYISICVRNARHHDKIRGLYNDINTDYILLLYEKQNGKCYFTHSYMLVEPHPMLSLSIDRIDNAFGHVVGNVRLVLKSINRAKRNYSDNDVFSWIEDVRKKVYAQ